MNQIDAYCSPAEARMELKNRFLLRSHIEKWWRDQDWSIPLQCFNFKQVAVFGRAVATRRYEDILFCEYAQISGFKPTWMEYTRGSLSTHSPFKRSLLHPCFYVRRGRSGGLVVETKKLAGLQEKRMQTLSEIVLDDGASLVEYHHKLHGLFGLNNSVIDLSTLFSQFGGAEKYYTAYLSLFVAHAVIFEDYHGGEDEGEILETLTKDIFLPACEQLKLRFGVGPLIVRMPWHKNLRYFAPPDDTRWQTHGVITDCLLSQIASTE